MSTIIFQIVSKSKHCTFFYTKKFKSPIFLEIIDKKRRRQKEILAGVLEFLIQLKYSRREILRRNILSLKKHSEF